MDGELQTTGIIMPCKVMKIVSVIDVIDLNFVTFSLLKVVLDIEALNPRRIQVIADHLRDAKLLP